MKNKCIIFFVIFLVFSCFSCMTLQQDIAVSTADALSPEIMQIEQEIAFMHADFIMNGKRPSVQKADSMIKKINSLLGDINLQSAPQAILKTFQGNLCLLTDRTASAKVYYQQAISTYKGEVHSIILGNRLGIIKDLSDQKVAKTEQALLTLETAIQLYQKEEYLQAVAKFDEAFISLDNFYQEAYSELRNESWKLRNISSQTEASEAEILKKDSINVYEMIKLTQQTTDYLFKFTASKKYSDTALVRHIISCGLLDAKNSTDDSAAKITKDTVVTRILAARFLWNIFTDKYGINNINSYQKQFSEAGFSPVSDLELDSKDFDAVLGCIEKELMELPDGINFYPNQKINPMDFNSGLKRINK